MNLEEKQEILNEYFSEIINEDPYEISREVYDRIRFLSELKVVDPDGDYSVHLAVELDGDIFMAEYQYSSWIGTFGDSKGFLPAEKFTYTEERYRYV